MKKRPLVQKNGEPEISASPNFIEIFKWQIQAMDNYVQLYKKSIEKCTKEQKKNYSNYDSIFQNNGLNTMSINTNEYDRNNIHEQMSAQSPVVHHRGQNSNPMYRHAVENNILIDKKKMNTHASQPVPGLILGRPKSHIIDKSQFPYKKTNVFHQNT